MIKLTKDVTPTEPGVPLMDGDLIEKANDAGVRAVRYAGINPAEDEWTCKYRLVYLTAALRVAMDAMLGPVTDEEYREWPRMERLTNCWDDLDDRQKTDVMLASRRARIEAPKSVEERVTIRRIPGSGVAVFDGEQKKSPDFLATEYAEIYRLGLIETLKKEAAK